MSRVEGQGRGSRSRVKNVFFVWPVSIWSRYSWFSLDVKKKQN